MSAEADSPEGDRLDVLVMLVEAYEREHYPIGFPDPVEAIKFRMEHQDLTVEDLVSVIGRKNRVYEILACKRPLTLRMMLFVRQLPMAGFEILENERHGTKKSDFRPFIVARAT